jgi:hypothetical protein
MTLSDAVVFLMVITFLPFNEGIIARAPRWKRLADAIDIGVVAAFNWRANANVTAELEVLFRYFKRASFLCGAALVVAFLLKSQPLIVWISAAFFCCLFACFSFEWTFKHRQAIKPFAPVVGFSLAGPWALLMLDYLAPNAGLMHMLGKHFEPFPLHPVTPFQIAFSLFLLSLAFFALYYLFVWLVFSPFAYLILVGLKLSRSGSRFLVRHFSRNLLNEVSVLIQFFGLVYLYFAGKPG